MSDLVVSPHNDDETLFTCFTLLRQKPAVLIVTDSWKQFNRGEGITAEDRWEETREAMQILNIPTLFRGGIRDDSITGEQVLRLLSGFKNFDSIYVPALQGGNPDHDLISKVADDVFGSRCKHYTTYTRTELYTTGKEEIVPTIEELDLKERAMNCYTSQLRINGPHFDAVRGRSEWFI